MTAAAAFSAAVSMRRWRWSRDAVYVRLSHVRVADRDALKGGVERDLDNPRDSMVLLEVHDA